MRFLSTSEEPDEWIWSGDLKLDTLGEVAIKLRAMPAARSSSRRRAAGSARSTQARKSSVEYIARVKLALVGGSVTAVFQRQVSKPAAGNGQMSHQEP